MFLSFSSIFKLIVVFYSTKILVTSATSCTVSSFKDVADAVANCNDIVIEDLIVPAGESLNLNLLNSTKVTVNGIVTFEYFPWNGPLVKISGNNIKIVGQKGSVFHGLGNQYWDGKGTEESLKPKFVTIEANDSVFNNINLLDCPIHCVTIKNSNSLLLNGWTVDCSSGEPGVSPPGHEGHNTDGFDVLDSNNVTIQNSIVHNQDDCVAVSRGTNLLFHALYCSGGHGLSLSASFSEDGAGTYDVIENVTFSTGIVVNSRNAIHVKSHRNSAAGVVKNVTYKNIQFSGISQYAINIQQDYENGGSTGIPNNNINITQLNLENVRGTVLDPSVVPVYILCGESSCYDWNWNTVVVKGDQINNDQCNFIPDGYVCKNAI